MKGLGEMGGRSFCDGAILEARLALAEAQVRGHEETLHEIGSTIGGVHAAARVLLQHGAELSEPQAASLQELLHAELGRLDRILAGADNGLPELVAIDNLLSSLVAAHRTSGHTVMWEPSDLHAVVVADGLSEAVNVLLTNGARHGRGATITVSAQRTEHSIEISVSDDGPGVDAAVRHRVFERGVRSDDSSGSGLGLFLARRALISQGATLELRDSSVGAHFVIGLPHPAPSR